KNDVGANKAGDAQLHLRRKGLIDGHRDRDVALTLEVARVEHGENLARLPRAGDRLGDDRFDASAIGAGLLDGHGLFEKIRDDKAVLRMSAGGDGAEVVGRLAEHLPRPFLRAGRWSAEGDGDAGNKKDDPTHDASSPEVASNPSLALCSGDSCLCSS